MTKRPEFTMEQEEWLCEQIGDWYLIWKNKITISNEPHKLGLAINQLKAMVCNEPYDDLLEKWLSD